MFPKNTPGPWDAIRIYDGTGNRTLTLFVRIGILGIIYGFKHYKYVPVSERCDDQPLLAAHVLVLVEEVDVRDGDGRLLHLLLEVEAALFQPVEIQYRFDIKPKERKN